MTKISSGLQGVPGTEGQTSIGAERVMAVPEASPFDTEFARRLLAPRIGFLDLLLRDWHGSKITTALDVGTGVGNFAARLAQTHKLSVTAIDIRPSNVEEAVKRHRGVRFVAGDIEEREILSLGRFDLVSAFGLLYHLENPARAVRHLAQLCTHLLVVESMIAPGQLPQAQMVDEHRGDDQGIRSFAFHLTESGLAKLLYRAGIPYVYKPVIRVHNPQFRSGLFHRRLRTILIGSSAPVSIPWLRAVEESEYVLDTASFCHLPIRVLLRKVLEYRRKYRAENRRRGP